MTIKTLLKTGSALTLGAVMTMVAAADAKAEYPTKPIKLYVGFSAGGGTDTTARGFASYVHEVPEMKGMPMVVVNKPGGSGMQAAKIVADAKPDGYTLYIINNGTFAAAELGSKKAPVKPREAFIHLGCMTQLVTSLTVHASNPAKDAAAWVKDAKASGKTIRWSTSGATTMHALVGHIFLDAAGIKHKKVPFKGGSKARAALVAQKVDVAFNGVHLRKGFENDIRPIGVPLSQRDPANKDVGTFAEQGLPSVDVAGPMCLYGPKGMPADAQAAVKAAIKGVAGKKGFARFMKKSGLAAFHIDAANAEKNLNSLYDKFGPLIASLKK